MRPSPRSAWPCPAYCSNRAQPMARFAIGDVQGCAAELRALLGAMKFSADRDQLWFVGDLVNRGPYSLECLRLIRALGDNAVVVLGNHDLHLLAMVFGARLQDKPGDTLREILRAPDRVAAAAMAARAAAGTPGPHARRTAGSCRPRPAVDRGAGAGPGAGGAPAHCWPRPKSSLITCTAINPTSGPRTLTGADRLRFIVNCLTRLRVCTAEGRVAFKAKGPPPGRPRTLATLV